MSPDQTPGTTEADNDMARRCPGCQTVFTVETSTSRQVFCSRTCREAHRIHTPVQRTCPFCQAEFTTDASPRRIFCSKACRNQSRNSEEAREDRTCPVCDTTFRAPKTVRQIYCSRTCRRDAERQRDQARDADRARRLAEAPHSQRTAPPSLPELPEPPTVTRTPHRPLLRPQPPERDPLEPTATRECPHCHQPVTIVALLATPEAARPTVHNTVPDIVPLRRTP
ncbi:hypothetical protein OEB94_37740 [Streptomyces sp. ICN988]|uniref:hypothetical protein n=1 Tax=Streptomyces sp. ICN988 TaxID=2983765 RepID=UPI0021E3FAE9|nr:hypothetical protein [Streptomyces sp. ICN988]MCV2465018.1 hypothetical protein [Streptomyces sp. ICN988]